VADVESAAFVRDGVRPRGRVTRQQILRVEGPIRGQYGRPSCRGRPAAAGAGGVSGRNFEGERLRLRAQIRHRRRYSHRVGGFRCVVPIPHEAILVRARTGGAAAAAGPGVALRLSAINLGVEFILPPFLEFGT